MKLTGDSKPATPIHSFNHHNPLLLSVHLSHCLVVLVFLCHSINMASSVFYKFNSRKDESRVSFDGTGISVFDLKREIILANNMGKANDFDLYIYDATSKQGE